MKITDAQVHIYEPDTPEHPWPKEPGRGAPPQKHARGFSALEMLGAMEAVGVDRAVIVAQANSGRRAFLNAIRLGAKIDRLQVIDAVTAALQGLPPAATAPA